MNGIGRSTKDRAPRWLLDLANASTRGYAMATSRWRPGPDFLIVGTKRGGTTSLWNNMQLHPQVLGMWPQVRGRKSTDFFFDSDRGSQSWYRSHFATGAKRRKGFVTGEASPYYMYSPHAPRLIAEAFPETKLIVLLRDPVERAYSHHQERTKQGEETLNFEEALAAEDRRLAPDEERWLTDPAYYSSAHDFYSYRSRGIYAPQIERIWEHFPREQVHIGRAEDFYSSYQDAFDEVTDFLGLERFELPSVEHHNYIPRADMPTNVREELTQFYRPLNAELQELLDRDFDWA